MPFYETIRHFLITYPHIFIWRDAIEILFFACLLYYFSRWLRSDKQKNLLFYFYGYCLVLLTVYYAQLSTLSTFLFISSPVAIVIFILVHQETLQRNFVALRVGMQKQEASGDWLETLMRACLVSLNHNKEMLCVIEYRDSLETFIETPLALHVTLEKNLLDMLLTSQTYDPKKIVWLTAQGTIRGINASWLLELEEEWLSEQVKELHKWKQDALFFTGKTDAIVFKIIPTTGSLDLVIGGKTYDQLSANATLKMIKKYLTTSQSPHKGEQVYDVQSKKQSSTQRSS